MPYEYYFSKSIDPHKPHRIRNKDTKKDKGGSTSKKLAMLHMRAMYAHEHK